MPRKLRATLNLFVTQSHENEEAKLPQKVWANFEKTNDLLFLHFYNSTVGILKVGPPRKCFLGSTGSFFR